MNAEPPFLPGDAFITNHCPHCSGSYEFPADGVGQLVPCPHCGQEITLVVPVETECPEPHVATALSPLDAALPCITEPDGPQPDDPPLPTSLDTDSRPRRSWRNAVVIVAALSVTIGLTTMWLFRDGHQTRPPQKVPIVAGATHDVFDVVLAELQQTQKASLQTGNMSNELDVVFTAMQETQKASANTASVEVERAPYGLKKTQWRSINGEPDSQRIFVGLGAKGVAERVFRAHNISLNWQNATLSQLMDAEGRINTAARIKAKHALSFNWQEYSLKVLLDDEGRLDTAARIRRNHSISFDWQKNSLSTLLDAEGRLNTAQRISKYGKKVDWRSYTLSQLLAVESKPGTTINRRKPAQNMAGTRIPGGLTPTLRMTAHSGVYLNVGEETWITEVMAGGELVKLQDGSLWQVAPLDRINATLWLATTAIVVIDGDDPTYPYMLINKDDRETVDACLLAQ